MNRIQNSKLMMYYSVISVSEAQKPVWENNTPYSSGYQLFTNNVSLIESHRDRQVAEVLGTTAFKEQKQKEIINLIVFAEHRLKSYATATGNTCLAESLVFSLTKLKHVSAVKLPVIAKVVIQLIKEHIDSISPYGIDEIWLKDFTDAAEKFNTEMLKPRNALAQKKIATDMLAVLFKETDIILRNRLDYDAEVFMASNPEFYNEYMEARRTHESGSRGLMVKAKAILDGSSTPLKNVCFTFTRSGNNMLVIEKKTTEKGNFVIKNIPEGEYDVRVYKAGLKEQILKIKIENGEMLNLNIRMEAA